MYVYVPLAWDLWIPEEGIRSPGTGVTDDYEPPCGCWESNLGPLEEHPVFLTAGESFLQSISRSVLYSNSFPSSCFKAGSFNFIHFSKDSWTRNSHNGAIVLRSYSQSHV